MPDDTVHHEAHGPTAAPLPPAAVPGPPAPDVTVGPSELFDGLLPTSVAATEAFGDPVGAELFPQERAVVARAVASRRREFATVRTCARAALARLGVPPVAIVPRQDAPGFARNAPQWPAGVVGSMTHCDGYRAAAVARRHAGIASLGIDAEPHAPLPQGVYEAITSPDERAALGRLALTHPAVEWGRLLFSAKESVYKAWYPLTGRFLTFEECVITPSTMSPSTGTFTARLLVDGPIVDGVRLDSFPGRWRVLDRGGQALVGTAVTLPSAPGPR